MAYVYVAIRSILLFAFTLFAFRLMGKKVVGELTAFDMVVTIAMGTLLAAPLATPTTNIWYSVVAIGVLATIQIVLSRLSLRSRSFEKLVEGRPIKLAENGKPIPANMLRAKMSSSNLIQELRKAGYSTLSDIEVAYLEPLGKVSFIPKNRARPITPRYLDGSTSITLVEDGKIEVDGLRQAGLSRLELAERLSSGGAGSLSQVKRVTLSPAGDLNIVVKPQ